MHAYYLLTCQQEKHIIRLSRHKTHNMVNIMKALTAATTFLAYYTKAKFAGYDRSEALALAAEIASNEYRASLA